MDTQQTPQAYRVVIPVRDRILVTPLNPDEQRTLVQHGCNVEGFPPGRPDLCKGHMITFPPGTQMGEITSDRHRLLFPDDYQSVLLAWSGGSYSLHIESVEPDLRPWLGDIWKDSLFDTRKCAELAGVRGEIILTMFQKYPVTESDAKKVLSALSQMTGQDYSLETVKVNLVKEQPVQ